MATVPTTPDFVPGEKLDSAYLNARVRDPFDFVLAPPECAVSVLNVSTTNATQTLASWTAETFDNDAMWSVTPDPSRIIIKTEGRYHLSGLVRWAANATGAREIMLRVNSGGNPVGGSPIITSGMAGAATYDPGLWFIWPRSFAVNDYIELFTRQNSGGNLNVSAWVSVRWMGRP